MGGTTGAGVLSGVLGFLGTVDGAGSGVGVFHDPLAVLDEPGVFGLLTFGLLVLGLLVLGLLFPGRVLEENDGDVATLPRLLRVCRWVGLEGDVPPAVAIDPEAGTLGVLFMVAEVEEAESRVDCSAA